VTNLTDKLAFVRYYNTIRYSRGSGGLKKNKREGGIVLLLAHCFVLRYGPTPLTFKQLYKERVREREIKRKEKKGAKKKMALCSAI
jgi:hypothetical protein